MIHTDWCIELGECFCHAGIWCDQIRRPEYTWSFNKLETKYVIHCILMFIGCFFAKENRSRIISGSVETSNSVICEYLFELLVAGEDYSDADCFVCAILSHGEEGYVYGTNGRVTIDSIIKNFKGDASPSLAGKPKMFFIQVRFRNYTRL